MKNPALGGVVYGAGMKRTEDVKRWIRYECPVGEFLEKLGLPPDTNVIDVHVGIRDVKITASARGSDALAAER